MAQPTATLCTSEGLAPRVEEDAAGLAVVVHYDIDTGDEILALGAAGLPALGSAYSAQYPLAVALRRSIEYQGGSNDPATGLGGWCRARIEYAPPGTLGKIVPTSGGLPQTYSEFGVQSDSITVYNPPDDLGGQPGPPLPPLNNGRGANRQRTTVSVQVHVFKPLSFEPLQLLQFVLAYRDTTNAAQISLPPLLGTFSPLSIEPGQALYSGGTISRQGNSIEIVHTIRLAEDFLERWQHERADGSPTGPILTGKAYPEAFWPSLNL